MSLPETPFVKEVKSNPDEASKPPAVLTHFLGNLGNLGKLLLAAILMGFLQ
jgi:hypothetical protein